MPSSRRRRGDAATAAHGSGGPVEAGHGPRIAAPYTCGASAKGRLGGMDTDARRRALELHTPRERRAAWAVHLLTASGVLVGILGLNSVIEGHARAAILWLVVAMVVDGLDGP